MVNYIGKKNACCGNEMLTIFLFLESGTMESINTNLESTDDLVPSLHQVYWHKNIFSKNASETVNNYLLKKSSNDGKKFIKTNLPRQSRSLQLLNSCRFGPLI